MADQSSRLPELLLEGKQLRPHPIGRQNLERSLPIKRVVCLLQIYIDLVEQALVAPGQALVELGLNRDGPRSPPWKSAMEAIMEPD
jgi:hypothetical protein